MDSTEKIFAGLGSLIALLLTGIGKLLLDLRKAKQIESKTSISTDRATLKMDQEKHRTSIEEWQNINHESQRLLKEALVKIGELQDGRLEELEHRVRCETELALVKIHMAEFQQWKKSVEDANNGQDKRSDRRG